MMKRGFAFNRLSLTLFLVLAPAALASSTWFVNGVKGSDSDACTSLSTACKTIGHAISLAAAGDMIKVAAATYTENLIVSKSLTIVGSGASTTIVDGGGIATVVTISSTSADVTLSRLTIRKGSATLLGGGIYNIGTLALFNSTVSGNTVASECVELCAAWGGGIYNANIMKINHSTISGNLAYNWCVKGGCSALGGGLYNKGTMTISNSAISGNVAHEIFNTTYPEGSGGGIYNHYPAILTINSSTVSGNTSFGSGGGITNGGTLTINSSTLGGNSASSGGGIYTFGPAPTFQNSIVANNSGGSCNGAIASNGYNLSSDSTCTFNSTGDLNNTDPKLGPLQNNGGPTQTMALPSGSPAIDAGNPSGCTDGHGNLLKTDQRGKPRPDTEDTGGCDIGAVEGKSD